MVLIVAMEWGERKLRMFFLEIQINREHGKKLHGQRQPRWKEPMTEKEKKKSLFADLTVLSGSAILSHSVVDSQIVTHVRRLESGPRSG